MRGINTTPQVIRACISMIRSRLQVTQQVPPTCTSITYTFITLFWRSSPEYFSLIAGWDKFCKRLPFLCGVCRWPINRPSTCNANGLHRKKKKSNKHPSLSLDVRQQWEQQGRKRRRLKQDLLTDVYSGPSMDNPINFCPPGSGIPRKRLNFISQ